MENRSWTDVLRENMAILTEHINLDVAMWNNLRASGVVTAFKRDELTLNATQSRQVTNLLEHLIRGNNVEFYKKFREALQDTNQGHIVTECLPSPSVPQSAASPSVSQSAASPSESQSASRADGLLTDANRKILKSNRKKLIELVDMTDKVWDELINENIIQGAKARQFQDQYKHPADQVAPFLDHLNRRPNSNFDIFCGILEENDQGHVVRAFLKPK